MKIIYLTNVKMTRDPEKLNNWPKASYWFATLIILYSHCAFCSPLQLLCSSEQHWGESSTDTFPTGKTSTTFNQHTPLVLLLNLQCTFSPYLTVTPGSCSNVCKCYLGRKPLWSSYNLAEAAY